MLYLFFIVLYFSLFWLSYFFIVIFFPLFLIYETKLGPQTRACAVPFVYVVAVETVYIRGVSAFC